LFRANDKQEKSAVLFSTNTGQQQREEVRQTLGVHKETLNERYLGLPAHVGISRKKVVGNSGKPVTLETLSLTKFSKHVFQEQGIHDFREPGT
jgi:hypothetical protein